MFIFKKHIPRRTVLKSAGAALALPFLDAMVPAATVLAQTAASSRLRGGSFYIPHGAVQFDTKFGPEGDLYICDIGNHVIRRVNMKTGIIRTFAGTGKPGPTPALSTRGGSPNGGRRVYSRRT